MYVFREHHKDYAISGQGIKMELLFTAPFHILDHFLCFVCLKFKCVHLVYTVQDSVFLSFQTYARVTIIEKLYKDMPR